MTDLLAARSQMAMSLAFHILFAIAGMAMPLLMLLAEWRHHRTGDPAALELAKRWAKGTASSWVSCGRSSCATPDL
jgi:cytochrome d ubiquinol oxidase subunit I